MPRAYPLPIIKTEEDAARVAELVKTRAANNVRQKRYYHSKMARLRGEEVPIDVYACKACGTVTHKVYSTPDHGERTVCTAPHDWVKNGPLTPDPT